MCNCVFCNLYGAFKIKFYFHASLKLKFGALRLCPNGDFFQVKKSLTLVPVMFVFFFISTVLPWDRSFLFR